MCHVSGDGDVKVAVPFSMHKEKGKRRSRLRCAKVCLRFGLRNQGCFIFSPSCCLKREVCNAFAGCELEKKEEKTKRDVAVLFALRWALFCRPCEIWGWWKTLLLFADEERTAMHTNFHFMPRNSCIFTLLALQAAAAVIHCTQFNLPQGLLLPCPFFSFFMRERERENRVLRSTCGLIQVRIGKINACYCHNYYNNVN